MTDLCFIDTETTGLHPTLHKIWEVAIIKRTPSGDNSHLLLQIDVDTDMGNADPFALNIGKFWERYKKNGYWEPQDFRVDGDKVDLELIPENGELCSPIEAARLIREFTHGAHLIGNCVSFDAERLGTLLRENWQTPTWHYHVIDIEPMIIGYAKAAGISFPLPYKSDELTNWLGVEEPSEEFRHTAMGDAIWVMRQWDALGM